MTRSDFMIKWGVYALAILPIWFLEVYVLNRLPVLGVQWHPERQAFALRRGEAADGAAVFWWLRRQAEKKSGG